ncbi:MAG: hypothetical protein IPP74_09675 [Alphaproteobacteria bacterium]|nr:hypothetical protein [Alphaproteobacteria bacterium]
MKELNITIEDTQQLIKDLYLQLGQLNEDEQAEGIKAWLIENGEDRIKPLSLDDFLTVPMDIRAIRSHARSEWELCLRLGSRLCSYWLDAQEQANVPTKEILIQYMSQERMLPIIGCFIGEWCLRWGDTFSLSEIQTYSYNELPLNQEFFDQWNRKNEFITAGMGLDEFLKQKICFMTSEYNIGRAFRCWYSLNAKTWTPEQIVDNIIHNAQVEESLKSIFIIISCSETATKMTVTDLCEKIFPFISFISDKNKNLIYYSWCTRQDFIALDILDREIAPRVGQFFFQRFFQQCNYKSNYVRNKSLEDISEMFKSLSCKPLKEELLMVWLINDLNTPLEEVGRVFQFATKNLSASNFSIYLDSLISKRNFSLMEISKYIMPHLDDRLKHHINSSNFKNVLTPVIKPLHKQSDLVFYLSDVSESMDDYLKSLVAQKWALVHQDSIKLDSFLEEVLPLINASFSRSRLIAKLFSKISKPSVSLEIFLEKILPQVEDGDQKTKICSNWFKYCCSETFSLEILQERILPHIVSEEKKDKIRFLWLQYRCNLNSGQIIDLIKSQRFINVYAENVEEELHNVFGSRPDFDQRQVLDICEQLYPFVDEFKIKIFTHFVRMYDESDENKQLLSEFILLLKQDDLLYDLLSDLKTELGLSALDIVELVGTRLHSQYHSIADILKGHQLVDSLTAEGMEKARRELETEHPEAIALFSLFSLYDLKGKLADFKTLLKPKLLGKIQGQFKVSDKHAYVTEAELMKLSALADVSLPKVETVTSYLKAKVPPVPPIGDIDSYTLHVEGVELSCGIVTLNDQFKSLLRSDNPDQEQVGDFFQKILQLDHALSADNVEKIKKLFSQDKSLFAYIFNQPDGARSITNLLHGLRDGCVANIGTQIQIAAYGFLIEDKMDQILYGVYRDFVAIPLINRNDQDVLGASASGINILDLNYLNRQSLSPMGLVRAINEQFYSEGKMVRDPWAIIKQFAGRQIAIDLIERWRERQDFDTLASNVATYLVLLKVSDILLHQEASEFRDKYAPEVKFCENEMAKQRYDFLKRRQKRNEKKDTARSPDQTEPGSWVSVLELEPANKPVKQRTVRSSLEEEGLRNVAEQLRKGNNVNYRI